jgi:hypothetical protein
MTKNLKSVVWLRFAFSAIVTEFKGGNRQEIGPERHGDTLSDQK